MPVPEPVPPENGSAPAKTIVLPAGDPQSQIEVLQQHIKQLAEQNNISLSQPPENSAIGSVPFPSGSNVKSTPPGKNAESTPPGNNAESTPPGKTPPSTSPGKKTSPQTPAPPEDELATDESPLVVTPNFSKPQRMSAPELDFFPIGMAPAQSAPKLSGVEVRLLCGVCMCMIRACVHVYDMFL